MSQDTPREALAAKVLAEAKEARRCLGAWFAERPMRPFDHMALVQELMAGFDQLAALADVPAVPAFELTRSIIYKCPAIKLPQSFMQKLGMMAQIIPLRGVDEALAQSLVDQLNAGAALASPPQAPQPEAMEALRVLVACKDTETRLKQLHEMGHGTDYDQHRKQFSVAWDRARALASAASQPEPDRKLLEQALEALHTLAVGHFAEEDALIAPALAALRAHLGETK